MEGNYRRIRVSTAQVIVLAIGVWAATIGVGLVFGWLWGVLTFLALVYLWARFLGQDGEEKK